MSHTTENSVDACVEAICNQGCQQVLHHIQELEQGTLSPLSAHLTPQQHHQLLDELKAIMAVYGGKF